MGGFVDDICLVIICRILLKDADRQGCSSLGIYRSVTLVKEQTLKLTPIYGRIRMCDEISETLDILIDIELMKKLKLSIAQADNEETVSFEEVMEDLEV